MTKEQKLRYCVLAACGIGFYALFQWNKQEKKTTMLMGYLKDHVQYHKDNNIPFGK